MSTIIPLWDRVIVQAKAPENETSSWIVLPSSKEKPMEWVVIAVSKSSDKITIWVWETILYKKYSATEVKVNWKEYLILDIEDVLATVSY